MAWTDWISEAASFVPLPGAGTAGQLLESGLQSQSSSDGTVPSADAIANAISLASGPDLTTYLAAFGDDAMSKWAPRFASGNPSDATVAEIIQLSNGGLNGRFNSGERAIRDATIELVAKYPLSGGWAQPDLPPSGPTIGTGGYGAPPENTGGYQVPTSTSSSSSSSSGTAFRLSPWLVMIAAAALLVFMTLRRS